MKKILNNFDDVDNDSNSIYVSKSLEKNYYIIIPKWYKCHHNFEILSLNIYDTLTNWTKKLYIIFNKKEICYKKNEEIFIYNFLKVKSLLWKLKAIEISHNFSMKY